MHKYIEPVSVRSAKVDVVRLGEESGVPVGTYVQLFVDGSLIMSEAPIISGVKYSLRMIRAIIQRAEEDVLMAGLGIGHLSAITTALDKVKSVTVIEKNPDVIEAILPQLRERLPHQEKLTVVEGSLST